jgi:hypothetical protein
MTHTCCCSNAAAVIARKLGATFAAIDCPVGRSMLAEFQKKLQDDDQSAFAEEFKWAVTRQLEEALGKSLAASFRLWAESDRGSKLLQDAVGLAEVETVMPERQLGTPITNPKEQREADAQRERGMCSNIIDLCTGKQAPQESGGHSGERPRGSSD